jgi:hypothetical protein
MPTDVPERWLPERTTNFYVMILAVRISAIGERLKVVLLAMVGLELTARSPAIQKSHVCVQISFPFALAVVFCFARFV